MLTLQLKKSAAYEYETFYYFSEVKMQKENNCSNFLFKKKLKGNYQEFIISWAVEILKIRFCLFSFI